MNKVLQIRFRDSKHIIQIIWAEKVIKDGNNLIFTGCRLLRVAIKEGFGLCTNYRQMIQTVTLRSDIIPTITECDIPEWWTRTEEEAYQELQKLLENPAAIELGKRLQPFTENLTEWLNHLAIPEHDREASSCSGTTSSRSALPQPCVPTAS